MPKIRLPYNEDITIDELQSLMIDAFPECKIEIQNYGINSPLLRVKKNPFVHAILHVNQKPKKMRLLSVAPWMVVLFGALWNYLFRGDFIKQVENVVLLLQAYQQ